MSEHKHISVMLPEVLAAMQPERARLVTAELAQLRTRAVTPAAPAAPQEKR